MKSNRPRVGVCEEQAKGAGWQAVNPEELLGSEEQVGTG